MKKTKNLKLPNWVIKNIEYSKEDEELSFIVVNSGAFYMLGLVMFFVYNPFGKEYLATEIICAIGIGILVTMVCLWLVPQITLLDSLRKEAVISYKNSRTKEEKEKAVSRLELLYVPIPETNEPILEVEVVYTGTV
jgi:hypothetical protein